MALASRAPGIQPRVFIPRMVEGRLIFGQGANRDDVRHAVDQIKHTKMPTIGRFFYAIAGHDEMDALGHFVDVPTHIVAGSHDRLIPCRTRKLFANGSLVPTSTSSTGSGT